MLESTHGSCPALYLCSCSLDIRGRREVVCDTGELEDPLPVMDMPADTEVLIVDALEGIHNTLTLEPIFKGLKKLEDVTVSRSKVPAIGEHSFWGLRYLHTLNISRNSIISLVATNFRGPEDHQNLDLSGHFTESMQSAVFRYAKQLKTLNLSQNRLPEPIPRVFFGLSALSSLDLSCNPLGRLPGMVFSDVQNLRELKCISCSLITITAYFFDSLPQLDLSNNRLTEMPPVTRCHHLTTLMLSGNVLTYVPEDAVSGLPWYGISLSSNRIKNIHPRAFYNSSSLTHFDISYNRLGLMDVEPVVEIQSDTLINANIDSEDNLPESDIRTTQSSYLGSLQSIILIASNLKRLVLSGNYVKLADVQAVLRQVRQLRHLGLGELGLTKLPSDFLRHARHLRANISGNSLSDFPSHLLYSTPHLHSLYLDHNNMRGLSEDLVTAFAAMRCLLTIKLEGNPWQCDACQVSAMIAWYMQ